MPFDFGGVSLRGRVWPCDWMERYWSLQIFRFGTRSASVLQLFTTFHHFFTTFSPLSGCEGPGDAVPLELPGLWKQIVGLKLIAAAGEFV